MEGSTGISAVTGAVSTITTVIGDVWTAIVGNPLLLVLAAGSLLSIGIAMFRKIKGAAR